LATRLPVGQRAMQATLTSLATSETMTASGRLSVWMDSLTANIGVPVRTLGRHLAQAVEHGWRVREVRGGRGRPSVYRATIPTAKSGRQLGEVVGHLVADSVTDMAPYA